MTALRKASMAFRMLCCVVAVMAAVTVSHDAANARYGAKIYTHWSTKHATRYVRARRVLHVAEAPANDPAMSSVPAAPAPRVETRHELLTSDDERLAHVGQHIIVGYYDYAAVQALVEKRALAGIFLTEHNVAGKTVAQVKAEIDHLQDIRKSQGLPPLLVASDQEGGLVSRLSPPLRRQPGLARVLVGARDDDTRRKVVEDYAAFQAAELKRIGVNINFGPVVDLDFSGLIRNDGETRLRWRTIGGDPYIVWKVAGWYCATLAKAGIMCTLKHFPGLGRVARDTHVASGEITASEDQLELNDWVPFRRLMDRPNVATMLGHVRVGALDKDTPASFSRAIIGTLLRDTWQADGLLITDDFSMGAITRSKDGIGAAAVKALNAGVDIVLISAGETYLDIVLSALISAEATGNLDPTAMAASRDRMIRILRAVEDGATN